ncbi:MAG TPA: protein translocase subunit SecD [bacterium]|nr:protein translocase subunit SecD [bacterium]HNS48899.1 protein translocase subunit SecD [bacterium]
MKGIYIRLFVILAVIGLSIWGFWPPQQKIRLGLDLRGGMQLVLQVRQPLVESKIPTTELTDRTLEVVRNRVDSLGLAEPVLQKIGQDRIMVQLPGVDDPDRAMEILGKTAFLEFKMVEDNPELLKSAIAGTVPEGYELLYQYEKDAHGISKPSVPLLLKSQAAVTGQDLSNAQLGYSQGALPVVDLEFNSEGARKFAEVTAANVNKRLAIVLDGIVQSAPVIREAIPSGKAQISGRFTTQEANDLALVLKAGALPARIEIIDRTVVGPSLGRDSINAGVKASLLGAILVGAFMIVYYSAGGLAAVFALGVNILILMAVMAYFRQTLTLPGIAGIALTIGMAVDANVLIFERIREELKAGRTIGAALDRGYDRALVAIIDSNLTTVIAAAILLALGRGSVKGFGLTLTIGVLANIFTAVFVTKVLFNLAISHFHIKKLHIG